MRNRTNFLGASLLRAVILAALAGFLVTGCSAPDTGKPPDNNTVQAVFTGLTADGFITATTTGLTLTFDKDIDGLSEWDIDLDAGSTGAVKGELNRTGTGVYKLAVSGITATGTVTVSVSKYGYDISGGPRQVKVYFTVAVLFTDLTADGSATATTTTLTLFFDKDIDGLSEEDIVLDAGSTRANKVTLIQTAYGEYELAVSGITVTGTVTVSVSKSGYVISDNPKQVQVYYNTAGVNTIDVPFIGPTQRIISITRTTNNGGSITLSITENFDNYEWFTGGGTKLGTGKSVTVYATNTNLVSGYNWITAVVYTGTGAGAIPWSGEFIIYVD